MRFLYALSLNAPWNGVATRDQNPRRHDFDTESAGGFSASPFGEFSSTAAKGFSVIGGLDKRL